MLSVVVIAKNEEGMIKTCLESVKWADEIVVIDNGSTDKTCEYAAMYTNNVFKFNGDFSAMRHYGFKKTHGDWVLYIDADERMLIPLKQEISGLIKSSEKGAYAIRRKNVVFGEVVNYGLYRNDWMIRLIRRSSYRGWVGKVHEYAKFEGELGYTKNYLLHLTHRNIDHFIEKALEWSKIDANLRFEGGHPKMKWWRFVRILLTTIFAQGIVRRGFFSGTVGLIDSTLQMFSFFMTYVRLWELQRTYPLEQEYKDIDEKLLKNGFKF